MYRILVAVDFSNTTEALIDQAASLCKALQGQIRILHVDDSAPYFYAPQDPREPVSDVSEEMDPESHKDMKNIRDRLAGMGVEAEFRRLSGPAASNIALAAKEYDADLIAIGGHQHSHFFQYFFGTRTESLIRKAPCPILVVPAKTDD